MTYYRQVGEVPGKRHTAFRDDAGKLRFEELMGEEGFSSDSSLLYHRGVPSAIVDSQVWELGDQRLTPNHPLKPRHLKLHSLFGDDVGACPCEGQRDRLADPARGAGDDDAAAAEVEERGGAHRADLTPAARERTPRARA